METELDGLPRLQSDILTKALVVVVSVLAFLSLAAIFAHPARADLIDGAAAVIDQAIDVGESTTATVVDNGAPSGDENDRALLEEIVVEEIVVEEIVVEATPSTADYAAEDVGAVEDVGEALPVLEDVLEVVAPVVEDLLVVVDGAPIVEVVEEVPPVVEIVEETLPVVADVVIMVPPHVVDFVQELPWLVPDAVVSPGPIEVPTNSAMPTISSTREVSLPSQPVKDGSHQPSGLFRKELVAEMALLHLTDLAARSAASGSSASTVPERETAAMAPYVPIAGTVPVVGGAGASSSTGSSHSGSSFFGGLDAFSFFAALAALLALCLVGWIRDSSRSGRSIFPSHGGRPG